MNKRKIRKICSIFMVLTLMIICSSDFIHVSAHEINEATAINSEITPYGSVCGDCNKGQIVASYGSWGSWYVIDEIDCTHYARGTDVIQQRVRTVTWTCNVCGSGTTSTGKQNRTVCHGYNQ